ncbi:MAG TPA: metallophosphoesterase [Methylomirabilota bacterium]|nr:metallophosphoesterase [Methylomirabilota bacterium]
MLIEPGRVVLREAAVPIARWPAELGPIRIAALSDVHTGAPHVTPAMVRDIVARVNRAQPDLVVLLGDYVVHGVIGGRFVEPEATAAALRDLRAPLGVYAVLGNHDWWYDGGRVRRALEGAGIRVLENAATPVMVNGRSLWIAGVGDQMTGHDEIRRTLRQVPDGAPLIALTHNPDLFPEMPARALLTLAGHTHGGQVNLPLFGRLIVPSRYGSRYAIGHVREDGRDLFVTPGIGTSIIPVRFRVPPDVSLLTAGR